jgi:hypothetical protein
VLQPEGSTGSLVGKHLRNALTGSQTSQIRSLCQPAAPPRFATVPRATRWRQECKIVVANKTVGSILWRLGMPKWKSEFDIDRSRRKP